MLNDVFLLFFFNLHANYMFSPEAYNVSAHIQISSANYTSEIICMTPSTVIFYFALPYCLAE